MVLNSDENNFDKDAIMYPEHWHCPKCHEQEFMFLGWVKVCQKCYLANGSVALPQICTYFTCASS